MSSQLSLLARAGAILSALVLLVVIVTRRPAAPMPPAVAQTPAIKLLHDGKGEVFAVCGVGGAEPLQLSQSEMPESKWTALFAVTANATGRPMLGTYWIAQGTLWFRPQWPLVPGVIYTGTYHPDKFPGAADSDAAAAIVATFTIPTPPLPPPAYVAGIYPSSDQLPENLLRFYLQFTGPMRRGDVYDFVRLIGPEGKAVESPFVTFGEELWNAEGTRLTLLLDPGRQKHDLLPRQQAGPVLEARKEYTLTISGDWPDACGRPLGHEIRKRFTTVAADPRPIQPADWKMLPPPTGTREPLVVTFDRPLDRALLQRMDTVLDFTGATVAGEIAIGDDERSWRFVPRQPWTAGEYSLVVDPNLEDVSGNRVGRAFEVEEDRTEPLPTVPRRTFSVGKK